MRVRPLMWALVIVAGVLFWLYTSKLIHWIVSLL